MKNESYGILNIELARVREGDPNEKMLSMLRIDNPSLDWVKLAEAQGVPATRATPFPGQYDRQPRGRCRGELGSSARVPERPTPWLTGSRIEVTSH
jgi:hypothetical protein